MHGERWPRCLSVPWHRGKGDLVYVSIVALLFSAAALVMALLSVALIARLSTVAKGHVVAPSTDEPAPAHTPASRVLEGAWIGSVSTGYKRDGFTVCRMPTLGTAWSVNETEWVAYFCGKRVMASKDLAEVLEFCEGNDAF